MMTNTNEYTQYAFNSRQFIHIRFSGAARIEMKWMVRFSQITNDYWLATLCHEHIFLENMRYILVTGPFKPPTHWLRRFCRIACANVWWCSPTILQWSILKENRWLWWIQRFDGEMQRHIECNFWPVVTMTVLSYIYTYMCDGNKTNLPKKPKNKWNHLYTMK